MYLRQLQNVDETPCNSTLGGACVTTPTDVGLSLMALIQGITLVLAMATNGIVCLVFYKKPHLLSVNNSFVLNLSCCQLIMAVLIIPFSMVSIFSTKWIFNDTFCTAEAYLLTSCIVTTQLSLMVISVDRNYAIINSLRYPYVFTQRRANVLISATWTLGFVTALPPLIGWGKFDFISSQYLCGLVWSHSYSYLIFFTCFSFLVPLIVQSWCYLSIFRAALGHSKRSSRVFPSMPSTVQRDPPSDCSECSDVSYTSPPQYRNVECKAVRTILFIACAYSICWVPYFVASFETIQNKDVSPSISSFAICGVFLSTVINPVIYAFFNRVTRYEINKFFCDSTRKMNGRTTTADDSDEYYSTTVTNFSSSRQTPGVWTTRQKVPPTKTKGIEMNTIVEETDSKYNKRTKRSDVATPLPTNSDTCTIQESVSVDVTKLAQQENVATTGMGISLVLQSSISVTESLNPSKPRPKRARSEFLTGKDTFYSKTLKDSGSFLFFERNCNTQEHKHHHHRHHHREGAWRTRSNSHLPTSFRPQGTDRDCMSLASSFSPADIRQEISFSKGQKGSVSAATSSCDIPENQETVIVQTASDTALREDEKTRTRSDTASSDNVVLMKRKERLQECSKDSGKVKSTKADKSTQGLSKSVTRRLFERNLELKDSFDQFLARSWRSRDPDIVDFRERSATCSSDSAAEKKTGVKRKR